MLRETGALLCRRLAGWPTSSPVENELASLIPRYWQTRDRILRAGIEKVAYRLDSRESLEFMKRVAASKPDDGEDLYFPLNYLAKRCVGTGLEALATGRFRNQGSLQYATSVELFGKCGYRPGIPYLVEEALRDASLNIVIAAGNSLRALYPQSPASFDDIGAMQQYYCGQAAAEGFRVRCGAGPGGSKK